MRLFRSLLFQAALWAILPLLVITAVSVVSIYGHQAAERDLVAEQVLRVAHISANAISNTLEDKGGRLVSMAQTGAPRITTLLQPANPSAGGPWLDAFDRGLVLLSPDGQVVATAGPTHDWSSVPQVRELQTRAQVLEDSAFASAQVRQGNEELTLLATRVPDGAPGADTLVGAFATPGLGAGRLFEVMHLGERGSSYLVDQSGAILASFQPAIAGDPVGRVRDLSGATAAEPGALFYDEAGEAWALGHAPVGSTGWTVIVREPWVDAVGPMAQFAVVSPLLVILAAIVSLVAVYLILGYVIRPLRRLGQMADAVASGDYAAVEQPLSGVQEIQDLHGALRHMVDEIGRYQAGLQSYVAAVTQGQEEERKRLARELHDDTAQSLIGLMQRIKLARRDMKRDPARVEERLAELEQLSTAAWQDVRRFSEALRPAYLEQFGLEPALSTLTQQAGTLPGAPEVSFTVEGKVRRLASEVELALFRIVQEALNNARQHASATQVDVRLAYDDESVTLTVVDDGQGFVVPEFPGALAASGHYGLAGMRERVLLVGGQFVIHSTPARGTHIVVSVPAPDLRTSTA